MDHEQELAWKQQNINYGGCDPNDHMFYLTFEEFNLKHTGAVGTQRHGYAASTGARHGVFSAYLIDPEAISWANAGKSQCPPDRSRAGAAGGVETAC